MLNNFLTISDKNSHLLKIFVILALISDIGIPLFFEQVARFGQISESTKKSFLIPFFHEVID